MLYDAYSLLQRVLLKIQVIVFNFIIHGRMKSHKGIIIKPHQLKGLSHISLGNKSIVAEGAIITEDMSKS